MNIGKKQQLAMDHTACSVRGVLDNLRVSLQMLDAEIKGEERSKMEFDRRLLILSTRRDELLQRTNVNKNWLSAYEKNVGPFAQRYKEMTHEIGSIYKNAKVGHTRGIKLLEDSFDYHPLFKRPGDTFTATAFRPT